MCYFMKLQGNQIHPIFLFLFYILTLCVVYLFMLIYLTQIDKQNKVLVTEQTNLANLEQTEASYSEHLDTGKVKLKIKRRHINNKRIYVTCVTTLCIYVLFMIFLMALTNINNSSSELMSNDGSFFKKFLEDPIGYIFYFIPTILSLIVILFSTFFQVRVVNE